MVTYQLRRRVVSCMILISACSPVSESDQLVGPGALTEVSPISTANIGICNGVFDDVDPSCNGTYAQIGLVAAGPGAGPEALAAIAGAIGPWQLYLRPGETLGVPQVFSGARSKTISVIFPSGPVGDVCGTTPAPGGVITTIVLTPAASCGSIQTGPRDVVIRHEVAHVLGWDQGHGGDPARNSSITGPYSGRCTTFIHKSKNDGPIPPNVCPHEVEVINRAYTDGWSANQNGLYDQEILMKTDALSTKSVDVGGSAMIAAPHWVSWPSDQMVSRTQNDVGWTVVPSTRASVTDEGLVTGSQVGAGLVWLRAKSAAPAGYAMWTPFRLRGDSVVLTVTTPPPVALQVSDIVVRNASTDQIVALPITAAGEYAIDAVVIGTPTWTRIDWAVIDSRSPNDTTVATTQAPSVRQLFSAYRGDSYNRRFIMTPFSNSTQGFYHIRDVPICVTGGNQLASGGKKSSKTGPTPNMVGGCN